jgi:FkbM family methyltransferase
VEARLSVLGRLLATANRLPVGERAIVVGGDRLYVASLDRWLAALAWKAGLLEGAERRLIARVVRAGMVAVDVGANVGVHTLGLARAVGPAGRVHAVEPDPDNFRLLARAVREAGLAHVTLHRAAAAERAGTLDLHLSPVNRGDHRTQPDTTPRAAVRVPAVALDDVLAAEPRVDFVKIDVQGDEAAVLRGLGRTLARSPGVGVLCELAPALLRRAGAEPADCLALLRAAGLRPHRVRRDGAIDPVDDAGAVAAAGSGHANLYFVGTG